MTFAVKINKLITYTEPMIQCKTKKKILIYKYLNNSTQHKKLSIYIFTVFK